MFHHDGKPRGESGGGVEGGEGGESGEGGKCGGEVGGESGEGGEGGEGEAGGERGGGCEAQTVKPAELTDPSDDQLRTSPAAMATSVGPLVPQYPMPLMVRTSYEQAGSASTSNPALAVTVSATAARTVQLSPSP